MNNSTFQINLCLFLKIYLRSIILTWSWFKIEKSPTDPPSLKLRGAPGFQGKLIKFLDSVDRPLNLPGVKGRVYRSNISWVISKNWLKNPAIFDEMFFKIGTPLEIVLLSSLYKIKSKKVKKTPLKRLLGYFFNPRFHKIRRTWLYQNDKKYGDWK